MHSQTSDIWILYKCRYRICLPVEGRGVVLIFANQYLVINIWLLVCLYQKITSIVGFLFLVDRSRQTLKNFWLLRPGNHFWDPWQIMLRQITLTSKPSIPSLSLFLFFCFSFSTLGGKWCGRANRLVNCELFNL